jgi:hypothetical protein
MRSTRADVVLDAAPKESTRIELSLGLGASDREGVVGFVVVNLYSFVEVIFN